MSIALATIVAIQAGTLNATPLFARFAEIAIPYVQCVQAGGSPENLITPAHGSDMSWAGARAAFRQQSQADDTACRFYATHDQLSALVAQRYPSFDTRIVGFIAHDMLQDLQRSSARLESLDQPRATNQRSGNGLPFAPPPPPPPPRAPRNNAENR